MEIIVEISREMRDEIVSDLAKTRAPSRTAKNLGYSIKVVLAVAEEQNQPRSRFEEKYGGLGRPELVRYTVSRKKAWEVWDNDSGAISRARADYEAGTHEMCTGRDGDWLILYSIPNKWPAEGRTNYFLPESAL